MASFFYDNTDVVEHALSTPPPQDGEFCNGCAKNGTLQTGSLGARCYACAEVVIDLAPARRVFGNTPEAEKVHFLRDWVWVRACSRPVVYKKMI